VGDRSHDIFPPSFLDWLKKDLEKSKVAGFQFRQGAHDADERVKLAACKRKHELARQAELNDQCVFSLTFIPNLLQAGFRWPKHGLWEKRLQLATHLRGILLSGSKLHAHSSGSAEQLEGDGFSAKRETAEKLIECFLADVELGRQGSL
jgi:hypothetical protein